MSRPKISVVLPVLTSTPFLVEMTKFCIKLLRMHADHPFELVIVEGLGKHFDYSKVGESLASLPRGACEPDKYLHFNPLIGGVRELNAGLKAATGEFTLSMGNDIFVPPHWDTELLRVFEERKDCGIASMSALEPGAYIGPHHPVDMIVEGHYSPFMMTRSGDLMCEDFRKIYQDSDFIMRVYERGQRAFRTCRAQIHHLVRMTSDRVNPHQHQADIAHDERLFYERWGRSPLMIFNVLRHGWHQWGKEHEKPALPLHYNPDEKPQKSLREVVSGG